MFGSKKKKPDFKFELGDKLRDRITGFTGVCVYRTQWIHNCNVYGLQPDKLKDDGTTPDREQFDEPQLEVVEQEVVEKSRKTGGPTAAMPSPARM